MTDKILKKKTPGWQNSGPARSDFQYLEDLATAYWYSETLFAAIELNIFKLIESHADLASIARAASLAPDDLQRLLKVLENLDLIAEIDGKWHNSEITLKYLAQDNGHFLGNFFLYRKYIRPNWQQIPAKIKSNKINNNSIQQNEDYPTRVFNYVKAMDELLKNKALEISEFLKPAYWEPPILDIGGGAGALGRCLIESKKNSCAEIEKSNMYSLLFELPEIIESAKKIYSEASHWKYVKTVEGEFRERDENNSKIRNDFGLILLSNFLHAYGEEEARSLVNKAAAHLSPHGMILIHDYFPDRKGRSPHKGRFYDLNMMLNTFNGKCHLSADIKKWLKDLGFGKIIVHDLKTDSSIIIAERSHNESITLFHDTETRYKEWEYFAVEEGFKNAVLINASEIIAAPWVPLKCRYGCPLYDKILQCPPRSPSATETIEVLRSYKWALVLESEPPGSEFHKRLLSIERRAFLSGFYKAFAYGAGPCTLCDKCPEDGICRFPEKTRPSMEGAGIDVYAVSKSAGLDLKPVKSHDAYVKFIGLLLLD